METSFYIDISIQSPDGPRRFARFELGSDREAAHDLFKKLKGSPEIDQKDMLHIGFMETVNGLPVNVDVITCDLQELGINTMLITQEVFRLTNLNAGK
ncbi:MAG TPA: hypothetical protein VMZ03_01940 [Chitinophagaceae bacterium]|nr:hypothetical protein [Chitinophagaceae bacterium]